MSINKLLEMRRKIQHDLSENEDSLQKEYNVIFDDLTSIKDAVNNLENSCNYQFNECGDIEKWYCPNFKLPNEAYQYLNEYLSENYCIYYTPAKKGHNDLMIQRCDVYKEFYVYSKGAVFYNGKVLIESLGEETDEDLFNAIEVNMEKEGVFPGVYEEDYYGSVSLWKSYYKYLETKRK